MSFDASVPKALYQANIDLALGIAALLQESGAQWFELFGAEANARLAEAAGEAYRSEHDPRTVPAGPLQSGVILKWAQSNPARWQSLLLQAANHQSHFAEGLQAALQRWQAACTGAIQSVAGPIPGLAGGPAALPGWQEMTDLVQGLMAPFVPSFKPVARKPAQAASASASASHASRPAPKPSPTPKPASKPTPTPKSAAQSAAKSAPKPPAKAAPKATSTAAAKPAAKPAAKAASKSASVGASKKKAPAASGKKVPKPIPAAVTRSRRSSKPDV